MELNDSRAINTDFLNSLGIDTSDDFNVYTLKDVPTSGRYGGNKPLKEQKIIKAYIK